MERATDLIAEGALAMRSELTVDEIVATIHAHPTLGEAVRGGVAGRLGQGSASATEGIEGERKRRPVSTFKDPEG